MAHESLGRAWQALIMQADGRGWQGAATATYSTTQPVLLRPVALVRCDLNPGHGCGRLLVRTRHRHTLGFFCQGQIG